MNATEIFEQKVSYIRSNKDYKDPKKFGIYKIVDNQKITIIENIDSNYKSAAIMVDNLIKLNHPINYIDDFHTLITPQFLHNSLSDFQAFLDDSSHKNIQTLLQISTVDNIDKYFIYFIYR